MEKDEELQLEMVRLSAELTRLESIPAHLVTKKEKAARDQVEQQLAKVDTKHVKCLLEIKALRRTTFDGVSSSSSSSSSSKGRGAWLGGLLSS